MSHPVHLIVIGAATALLEIIDLVTAINAETPRFTVVGAIDDDASLHGKNVGGVEVLGGLSLAKERSDVQFVFAISSYRLRLKRIEIFEALGVARDRFVTLVHPRADVSSGAKIGFGCAIHSGAFVATGVTLGDFCIIYNSAVVSPSSDLGDFAMVAGLAFLGTKVRLETGAFAGGTSAVAAGITIGAGGMVGLASAAYRDVEPGHVVIGNPARTIETIPVPTRFLNS